MSSQPPWIPFALVPIVAVLLRVSLRWIFSLDEDPSKKPGVFMIPLRPLARVTEWILMTGAALAIVSSVESYSDPVKDSWLWSLLFGIGFAMLTGFIVNTHLWLDDEAMHYRSGLGRIHTIPWSRLDHYEIHHDSGPNSGTTYYYDFRSTDGEMISVSKSTYDINDLLLRISAHHEVREQPYRPRDWLS